MCCLQATDVHTYSKTQPGPSVLLCHCTMLQCGSGVFMTADRLSCIVTRCDTQQHALLVLCSCVAAPLLHSAAPTRGALLSNRLRLHSHWLNKVPPLTAPHILLGVLLHTGKASACKQLLSCVGEQHLWGSTEGLLPGMRLVSRCSEQTSFWYSGLGPSGPLQEDGCQVVVQSLCPLILL